MEFDWDPYKAEKNARKHDVTFETGTRVFLDAFRYETEQADDDDGIRYNVVGMVDGRLLHVTYTTRGDVYRIISARAAEPYERRKYHEV